MMTARAPLGDVVINAAGRDRKMGGMMGSLTPVYLLPCCSTVHGKLIQIACEGYHADIRVVSETTAATVREGLRGVNNDACYETIASVGRLLAAFDTAGATECKVVAVRLCADCRSMDTAA